MNRIRLALSLAVLAPTLAPLPAASGQTACPAHFAAGSAPELRKDALAKATREICYSGFALLHSGVTRTPLWSAEHLTRDRVAGARTMERENTFHAEASLPASERSELSDYVRSGYDRGHMAPSGDMPDATSQDESFTLANMIPQDPDNNRNLWADIEKGVRNLAQRQGEAFVVTGPVFRGQTIQSLKGRVLVPTDVWKAVYVPRTGEAGAYLVRNAPGREVQLVSLDQLVAVTGIDPFPGIPAAARAVAGNLPLPPANGRSREPGPVAGPAAEHAPGFATRILRSLIGGR